ncbi:MAG: Lrp/AsnC family transcriptional regulator [Burkholderiaceae bacterium]|jgi:Lrp/AsnC family leucine-responsive transcriptional regulator|nr:Lrp/AsnC family transcriptional regulator [Burkholderiaceae bacterium]MCZ8177093.1 Lrp/AsnC family transcriptional regulator [Burkholderiaceae bacterium]
MEPTNRIDAIDQRILQALQTDGRATYDELAQAVGLSASAVLRRVKRLEEAGVIAGYVALVDPGRVGLPLTAYISVRLAKTSASRNPIDDFAAAVQTWPEVVECAALTGEMDYLLRVLVRDMAHHSRFIMDQLLRHPSVMDCKTSFQLRRLKGTTAVPL